MQQSAAPARGARTPAAQRASSALLWPPFVCRKRQTSSMQGMMPWSPPPRWGEGGHAAILLRWGATLATPSLEANSPWLLLPPLRWALHPAVCAAPCPAGRSHGPRDPAAPQGAGAHDRCNRQVPSPAFRPAPRGKCLVPAVAFALAPHLLPALQTTSLLPSSQACEAMQSAPHIPPYSKLLGFVCSAPADAELLKEEGADLPHDTTAGHVRYEKNAPALAASPMPVLATHPLQT